MLLQGLWNRPYLLLSSWGNTNELFKELDSQIVMINKNVVDSNRIGSDLLQLQPRYCEKLISSTTLSVLNKSPRISH